MSTYSPPFSNLAGYARALDHMVKDKRAGRSDEDFVLAALRRFSDDIPVRATADIGDGSTKEWELGKTGEPFAAWSFGYSEARRAKVERLTATGPDTPPDELRDSEHRIEERTVSSDQKLYLVFADAPPASPQYRVHFKRMWSVTATANEVRIGHQDAVLYAAAALKCHELQAAYAATRTATSELFDGAVSVDNYSELAKRFEARYRASIRGKDTRLRRGQVRTGRDQIFGRGYRS